MIHRSLVIIVALLWIAPASASIRPTPQDEFDRDLLRIEEGRYLGSTVPDVAVVTESGTQSLHALIAGQPTILMLAYYTCGHACPATIHNLSEALSRVRSDEHRVITLSFDAGDDLQTMRHAKSTLRQVPANWTFGLLSREESERLTSSIGFRFFFSERDRVFVHPTVLVFLSPEGEVMRYLWGTEPRARDIELALVESRNRAPHLNELVDMFKLACFQFDTARSRYVLHPALIFGSLGIGILGVTGLAAFAYRPKGG